MPDTIINKKVYDWADIDLGIPGLPIHITSIDYSDELEKEHAYGLGNMPLGYGTGNYKPDGKLTMARADFHMVLDYCKSMGVSLYKLVIPKILVSYANDGYPLVTDTLNYVTLTKTSAKGSQGDKGLSIDLDLLIVGTIDWNGVKPV